MQYLHVLFSQETSSINSSCVDDSTWVLVLFKGNSIASVLLLDVRDLGKLGFHLGRVNSVTFDEVERLILLILSLLAFGYFF